MNNLDFFIYGVHTVFWWAFVISRWIVKRSARKGATPGEPATPAMSSRGGWHTARWSRALIVFHSAAFGTMYVGIGYAVMAGRVPFWFRGQRIVGTGVILIGAALVAWAVLHFRSWRFRAALDEGHQLATGGPFRLIRHPIYMGLDLLALGSAIWVPTAALWAAFLLMAIGSDLRGRAEERILDDTFGDVYRTYCRQTKRFVPGLY
jgi:protein-S-isoprenylcysteine O-methyltransferase Ste14